MKISPLRISERFQLLSEEVATSEIEVKVLIKKLGVQSHAFIVMVFSFPFLLPIPVPGLSVVFGALIALSGLTIAFNQPIWLPQFLSNKKINGVLLEKLLKGTSSVIKKFEFLFKPRLVSTLEAPAIRVLAGLLIAINGFLLFLPLPPGTNFPPALICTLTAISILERDGLILFISVFLFILKIILLLNLYSYFLN